VFVNRARRLIEDAGLTGFSTELAPIARGQTISSVGGGLWFTVWALYLTREVHLSLTSAGIAISIAGLIGFLAAIPLGRLADRHGPRDLYRALLIIDGAASLAFVFCSNFWMVVLVASMVAGCAQGSTGVSSALITQLAGELDRIEMLARIRACSHAGQALGAALGAIVIALDQRTGYIAAIILNAATFLIFAADISRVPQVPPAPGHHAGPRMGAVRDVPFTTLAVICGVLCLCWGLMSTGFPLWIADDTHAPRAISAAIVFASTLAIAARQTTFSRRSNTPSQASKAALRAGLCLAASCVLLAISSGPPTVPAIGLLLLAGASHILGELFFVAASKGFSIPLMNPDHPAEYQSVFAAGEALAIMLAPALMTAVIIPNHTTGWLALATVFTLAGAAATPAARWATAHHKHVRAHPADQKADQPFST
jgi:predicted MFS family arabinose efflux permease